MTLLGAVSLPIELDYAQWLAAFPQLSGKTAPIAHTQLKIEGVGRLERCCITKRSSRALPMTIESWNVGMSFGHSVMHLQHIPIP